MHMIVKVIALALSMQVTAFATEKSEFAGENEQRVLSKAAEEGAVGVDVEGRRHRSSSHRECCYLRGPTGPTGPQGVPGQPFGEYALFYLTLGATAEAGSNIVFDTQAALVGIDYDSDTGVFTLNPGTYSISYFYQPFMTPACNLYVNGELVLNSGIGGTSTVLTLTESSNTLVVQATTSASFTNAGANQSRASICIFQVD